VKQSTEGGLGDWGRATDGKKAGGKRRTGGQIKVQERVEPQKKKGGWGGQTNIWENKTTEKGDYV